VLRAANIYNARSWFTSTSRYTAIHVMHTLSEDDTGYWGPIKEMAGGYASSKTLDEFMAFAYYIEKKLSVVHNQAV